MCINYRMNMNSGKGILNTLTGAVGNVTGAVTNAVTGVVNTARGVNSTKKNVNVKPVTAGINAPVISQDQTGGMAPINFRYPGNMQQPSEAVMRWATTAGIPTPPSSEMRNVAHSGGKRKTRRHSKRKHATKRHIRHRSIKRKTHRRRQHKRRN